MPPRRTPRRSPSTSPSPPPTKIPTRTSSDSALAPPSPRPGPGSENAVPANPTPGGMMDSRVQEDPSVSTGAVLHEGEVETRLTDLEQRPGEASVAAELQKNAQNSTSSENDDSEILAKIADVDSNEDTDGVAAAVLHSPLPNGNEDEASREEIAVDPDNPLEEDAEIERLRRELFASTARIEVLQRKLRDSITKERSEFYENFNALVNPNQSKIVSKATSSPKVAQITGKSQEKLSFTPPVVQNNQKQSQEKGRDENPASAVLVSSGGEDEEGTQPQKKKAPATSGPTTNTRVSGEAPGKAKPASKKAKTVIERCPAKGSDAAEETEPHVVTSPYTGEGAGVCHTRAFGPEEAASALKKAKDTGANVPLPPQPPTVSAAVVGEPSHDDHVAALLKFWPHADVVAALAQTMTEEGAEDLQAAQYF